MAWRLTGASRSTRAAERMQGWSLCRRRYLGTGGIDRRLSTCDDAAEREGSTLDG
jgi:hypothetical protein